MRYAQNEFVIPDSDKVLGDLIIAIANKNRNDKISEQEQIKTASLNEIENLNKLDIAENSDKENDND